MTIMEKSQFGFSMMVLVFLLSLVGLPTYVAGAVDVSGATYTFLKFKNRSTLEEDLTNLIEEAKRQSQYFYVGVAKQYKEIYGTAIDSLCYRQGAVVWSNPTRCSRSDHQADEKAATVHKAKLKTVYYTNKIIEEPEVCRTEKNIITRYKGKTQFCLNVDDGHAECCIQSYEGIVYLRIYQK